MDPRTHFPIDEKQAPPHGECHLTGGPAPSQGPAGGGPPMGADPGGGDGQLGDGCPCPQPPARHTETDLLYIDLYLRPGVDVALVESQVRHVIVSL